MTATKTTTRRRRTDDQRIADLEARIEYLRQREAAKKVRASTDGKAFVAATKAVDKALAAARAAGNDAMLAALNRAQTALTEESERMGLRVSAPGRESSTA